MEASGSRSATRRSPSGVILYFHGGGFVMGSPQTHRVVTWRLARATGRRVLAIAYRKAPDHAFPAWIDDGVAALPLAARSGPRRRQTSSSRATRPAETWRSRSRTAAARGRSGLPGGMILFSPWADLGCEATSYRKRVLGGDVPGANVRSTGGLPDARLRSARPRGVARSTRTSRGFLRC